jgi:hypothetical protein
MPALLRHRDPDWAWYGLRKADLLENAQTVSLDGLFWQVRLDANFPLDGLDEMTSKLLEEARQQRREVGHQTDLMEQAEKWQRSTQEKLTQQQATLIEQARKQTALMEQMAEQQQSLQEQGARQQAVLMEQAKKQTALQQRVSDNSGVLLTLVSYIHRSNQDSA